MLYTMGDALLTETDAIATVARTLDATVIDVRLAPPSAGPLSEASLRVALGSDYQSWSQRMRDARTRTDLLVLVQSLFETFAAIREDQHMLLLGGAMRPELCARSWLASQYALVGAMLDASGHSDEDDATEDDARIEEVSDASEDDEDVDEDSDAPEDELFQLLPDTAHILASSDGSLDLMIGQRPKQYPTTDEDLEIVDAIVTFDRFVELLRSNVSPGVAAESLFDEESADAFRVGDCWHFHNDGLEQHSFFQGWRRTHRSGFVATFKSAKKAMLHRSVGCHHMGDTDWLPEQAARSNRDRASLTEAKKVCADELAQVEATVRASGVELTECAHCFGNR
jgi:hypothetical protein